MSNTGRITIDDNVAMQKFNRQGIVELGVTEYQVENVYSAASQLLKSPVRGIRHRAPPGRRDAQWVALLPNLFTTKTLAFISGQEAERARTYKIGDSFKI